MFLWSAGEDLWRVHFVRPDSLRRGLGRQRRGQAAGGAGYRSLRLRGLQRGEPQLWSERPQGDERGGRGLWPFSHTKQNKRACYLKQCIFHVHLSRSRFSLSGLKIDLESIGKIKRKYLGFISTVGRSVLCGIKTKGLVCFDRDAAGSGGCHWFLRCSKWQRPHESRHVRERRCVFVPLASVWPSLVTMLLLSLHTASAACYRLFGRCEM